MSTAQIRAIEDYVRLINRNAITHAIRAAVNLGIVAALSEKQHTLEELAEIEGLQLQPLQLLMNVLCETELVEKYGDDYALSAVGRLIPPQQQDMGDHYWQYLSSVIRTGVRLPNDNEVPVSDRDFLITWTANQWTHTAAALDVAEVLGSGETRKGDRILELGCGSAVFGATLAHHDPESQLVLVDEGPALKRAEKTIESIGLKDRCRTVDLDYRSPDLVSQLDNDTFDLVVLPGLLHRHSAEECLELLGRVAKLVKQDGNLAIIDLFPGQAKGDEFRTITELELFLRTSHGRVHSPSELNEILKSIGMVNIDYAHLTSPPFMWGLMLASRT